MSNQYNTAWQRLQRDRRYQNTLNQVGTTTWVRQVSRVEWTKSSFNVYYRVGNYEYHKNIIDLVRIYAGRLNQSKRDKISATAPSSIVVIRENRLCYESGCPFNTGIRSTYSFYEDDIKSWIENALTA